MKATNSKYDFNKSLERIKNILDADNKSFKEVDGIPARDKLTYENGFYVDCTAVFVDIRDSSSLSEEHRRPVLAKIYRSFISEMVALLNDYSNTREVNIHGDSVWCVCDTLYKKDIDDVFSLAARICSLADVINYELKKRSYTTYEIGVGIDYGRALMIKAGHYGSGLSDVVWMGDVVNKACHLCSEANKTLYDGRIFLSSIIYDNLCDDNKKLCSKDYRRDLYMANIVNVGMNDWLKSQNK